MGVFEALVDGIPLGFELERGLVACPLDVLTAVLVVRLGRTR